MSSPTATDTRIGYGQAIAEAVRLEMGRDPRVVYVGSPETDDLARSLEQAHGPQRLLNPGAAGRTAIALSVGAAMEGWRPVCRVLAAELPSRGLDQLVVATEIQRDAGMEIPMTVLVQRSAPNSSSAIDSEAPERWLCAARVSLFSAANASDAKGLVASAIRASEPVCVIDDERLEDQADGVPEGGYLVELGKAEVVRPGDALTLIAHGAAVGTVLQVAKQLKVEAEVVDLRSLYPLDLDTILASVRRTGRVVIAEPTLAPTPVGDAVVGALVSEAFEYLDAPPVQVALAAATDQLLRGVCDELLGY